MGVSHYAVLGETQIRDVLITNSMSYRVIHYATYLVEMSSHFLLSFAHLLGPCCEQALVLAASVRLSLCRHKIPENYRSEINVTW